MNSNEFVHSFGLTFICFFAFLLNLEKRMAFCVEFMGTVTRGEKDFWVFDTFLIDKRYNKFLILQNIGNGDRTCMQFIEIFIYIYIRIILYISSCEFNCCCSIELKFN